MTPIETSDDQRQSPGGRAPSQPRSRRCIVSGDILSEGRLLRFVADPDSKIVVDVKAKLPGRGLWVRSEREYVARAVTKRLFARAAKAPLHADDNLPSESEARLVAHMLAMLGLARRAGEILLGFDTIDKALRGGKPPALIVEASDGAPDGTRKLQAAALKGGTTPFVIGCFSSGELSLALGRTNVVHAALKSGRMAEQLIFDAGRIAGFRPLKPWKLAEISSRPAPANSVCGFLAFGTS